MMQMADGELLQKIHGLGGDIDLAALLCLMSREHCIISTEPEALDDLVEELQLVASQTFNLKCTALVCSPQTTLDDFAAGILLPQQPTTPRCNSPVRARTAAHGGQDSYFHQQQQHHHHHAHHHHASSSSSSHHQQYSSALRALSPLSQISTSATTTTTTAQPPPAQQPPPLQMANVVLARDLDKAPKAVQIQALELLRTRRIFTRTSVQAAPKQFLFIAVVGAEAGGQARLPEDHLNDFFYMSHWHDPLDGFAHLDALDDRQDDDETESMTSAASVIRRRSSGTGPEVNHNNNNNNTNNYNANFPTAGGGSSIIDDSKIAVSDTTQLTISEGDIAALALASRQMAVDIEVTRYQLNVVSFLRMHRATAGGMSPTATKHLDQLVRSLTTLHGLEHASEAMVELAARKIYTHRIRVVAPEKERSVQWGSELAAVEQVLEGVGPEDVLDDVLAMVGTPL